jgi:hypothetical protein
MMITTTDLWRMSALELAEAIRSKRAVERSHRCVFSLRDQAG